MGAASSRPVTEPEPRPRTHDDLVREERAIHAAALAPEDVSACSTLFDRWLSCYALGRQLRNVYRYGEVDDCARYREDFKFCLTLRTLSEDARRRAWIERRADASAHERMGPRSSECVWTVREPVVPAEYVDKEYPPP
ncbi:hypothetical protein MCUN1_002387 [Malassezia cuniculi]|uniref:Early meiotic induction protein 1 n=1 Tax=Malassezia cuniculi TaxID=948313 RepID=A0AAF0EWB9_9BASI|nr:hypothetical protein MCUN1_002387 [Malassezia cuniculi]